MEDCSSSIAAFCRDLRSLFSHLDSSCTALRNAVDHRPSFLPSQNLPSLLTALIDRISTASDAVKNLESMTVDTISFEELIGHCMEIYKQNEHSITVLEDRLKELGHAIPENIVKDAEELSNMELFDVKVGLNKQRTSKHGNEAVTSALKSVRNSLTISSLLGENGLPHGQEPAKESLSCDSLYNGTVSLQDLGLSAAGLACLAQDEGSSPLTNADIFTPKKKGTEEIQTEISDFNMLAHPSEAGNESAPVNDAVMLLKPVDEDEYFNSPTWLKMQVSLEDLNKFVDSICTVLSKKKNSYHTKGHEEVLDQDDLSHLTGGDKLKPCMVFLVKLGRLRVGHENGAPVYYVIQH